MRILLTGATGFIGSHLLDALLADGHQLVALARNPGPARAGVQWLEADFASDTTPAAWRARLHGIDAVINTVGIFREHGRQRFDTLHAAAPIALFQACAAAGVGTVIQLSALGADSAARSAYHLSKKRADDALAGLPLRGVIVQPSLVYGKDGVSARAFRTLASMPFALRFGAAPQRVQPIHIDELCAAIVQLLHAPQAGRIALVGPRALSFTDYLATLRAGMGLGRLRVLTLPGPLARALAWLAGKLPGALLDPEALAMLERGNSADVDATARLLGRLPRPPETFIEDARADAVQAKLGWLLPLLRAAIAAVWMATAIVSAGLYPVEQSYVLLERSGIPAALGPLMLYGACLLDLLFGIGTLFLPRRRWLWRAQLALIGFYTVVIALRLPEYLVHPYGPLTKNLPMLAAIWLLAELEE